MSSKAELMSNNPINLGLRFLLEIAALFAVSFWGWSQHEGVLRLILMIGAPLIAAVIWGTFRVPGEPAEAPVAVSGIVRLLIEAAIFGGAIALLLSTEAAQAAALFGVLVIVHYILSYDRVVRLISRKSG